MRTNTMKQSLSRGETALGCSLMFPCPQIVEMLAYAGFHWVLLDCEHGSLSLADVEVMCMAADASGITPIARPRSNHPADIQSMLDRGAHGVQVPHVNSADAARRVVSAVKFGPGAARGLAAGTRPDRWGMGGKMPDFAMRQNAETLIAVQIEHSDAVANIDEILAVDGIDVIFIGPSDLSQSMGHPGNPREASVARAIAETLAKITGAERTAGMPADATTLATVRASGCRYIYTHLPKVLADGARTFVA